MHLVGLECDQLGPIAIAYLKSPNEVTLGHYPTFSCYDEWQTKKAFVCEKNVAAFRAVLNMLHVFFEEIAAE